MWILSGYVQWIYYLFGRDLNVKLCRSSCKWMCLDMLYISAGLVLIQLHATQAHFLSLLYIYERSEAVVNLGGGLTTVLLSGETPAICKHTVREQ